MQEDQEPVDGAAGFAPTRPVGTTRGSESAAIRDLDRYLDEIYGDWDKST